MLLDSKLHWDEQAASRGEQTQEGPTTHNTNVSLTSIIDAVAVHRAPLPICSRHNLIV